MNKIISLFLAACAFMIGVAAVCIPAPAGTPGATATPGISPRLVAEKARLEQMERLAHSANPNLKGIEDKTLALTVALHKKQEISREAINNYLAEKGIKAEDLPKFKLAEATDLLMRIMPYVAVTDPQLKDVVMTALKHGAPVYPDDFAQKFPGKKPAQVPDAELLRFYLGHLQKDAAAAKAKLDTLVKENQIPDFMMQSMRELTRLKCTVIIYRNYIMAVTPPELVKQRRLVADMEGRGQKN